MIDDDDEYEVPFSVEDWMKGRVPDLNKPVKVKKGFFQYGVHKTSYGGVTPFVVRRGKTLPENILFIDEIDGTAEEARKLASDKAKTFPVIMQPDGPLILSQSQSPLEFIAGSIVVHSDNHGTHSAAILRIDGDQAQALFLTSKVWGIGRGASLDECVLFGLKPRKVTYLTLVSRPLDEFFAHKGYLPPHRLEGYLKEFHLKP